MLPAGAWFKSRLLEPEFYDSFADMDHSGMMTEVTPVRNPNYLSGTKRDVFQFLPELLPAGQTLIFSEMDFVHTWQLPVYSAVTVILTTAAGLAAFRRKDLR